MMRTLDEVLQYHHEGVILRFLEEYEFSRSDADEIFMDTKRWLWVCANAPDGVNPYVDQSTVIIDKMWHHFVLFTRDYREFCDTYFGKFLDHFPFTDVEYAEQKDIEAADPDDFMAKKQKAFTTNLRHVGQTLGKDFVVKWYLEYPKRYPAKRIADALRLPPVRQVPRIDLTAQEALAMDLPDLIPIIVDRTGPVADGYGGARCGAYCSCSRGKQPPVTASQLADLR